MGKKKRKKLRRRLKKAAKSLAVDNPLVAGARAAAKGDIAGVLKAGTFVTQAQGLSKALTGKSGAKGPGDISTEPFPQITNQEEQRKADLRRRFRSQASRQSFSLGSPAAGKRTLGGT